MNPIIKALQDELEKEINSSKGLHPLTELHFKMGLKASNAFWLPLLEKAVEMAGWIEKRHAEDTGLTYTEHAHKSAMTYRKAREFLTTLTDAKKEKKLKDLKKDG